MRKILFLLAVTFMVGMAMGQQVINGVYQGSPTSFMYLPTSVTNNSWVKPSRAEDGNFNSQVTQGAVTSGSSYTHRFVYTTDSMVSPANDPCFRTVSAGGYSNMPLLGKAWNSDLYPNTFVDSVIQMGGPTGTTTRGKYAQQMLYSFKPDLQNPVLLLQFAFVTEGVFHESHAPRNPGVEFALLNHGTNNFLNLGNYSPGHPYAQFWYGTPLNSISGTPDPRNTPLPASVVPQNIPKGSCNCSQPEVFVFPYTIVAFDLSQQARAGQAVDFRVREWACNANVHWSYCYFTAKMIPAVLQVKYCGGDSLKLQVPWGFEESSYQWYNGVDSATTTNTDAFWFDPDDPSSSLVHQGSTKYRPILQPNPERPYFRCVVKSSTNVPFTYQATVNYYVLRPSFTVENKALTSEKNCDLGVVLHNTSEIGIIRPNGQGGVDTTWQNLELNPDQCNWDFGDGTTDHGFEPEHIYAQPGSYTIKLNITDFERICMSADVDTTITLSSEYMDKQYSADTVTTCEGKLPYYYKPEIFGNDNVQTRWDLNAVGERQVNYSYALPQYHIRAWNGCDSIVKVHFDVLTPAVTIQEGGTDFCDSAQTLLIAYPSNVQEDAVEYEWHFLDSVMSTTNSMLATCDGTYSVNIIDLTTGCEAANSYKIDPCVPNVFLPNCITPTRSTNEGPVQNDYFYLDQFVQRFISQIKFMVYARDGEQVYYYEGEKDVSGKFEPPTPFTDLPAEMDGRLVLWDGKINGRIVSGTYTYALWIVSGGQQYLYKGRLMVM